MKKKKLISLKLSIAFVLSMFLVVFSSMAIAAPVKTDGPDYKVNPITIDKKTTVLLSCHMQNDIANPEGKLKVFGVQAGKVGTADQVAKALKAARENGLMVWHLNTYHRPGYPEYGRPPLPAQCEWIKKEKALLDGEWGQDFVPGCEPVGEEVIIRSPTVSGFAQGDMAALLQGWGIKTVVLMGVSTASVIVGTTIDLKDHAFKVIILGDCCSAKNWEEHNFMLTHILTSWATISNLDYFIKALKK
jgi:nicotinamidase-related amidase